MHAPNRNYHERPIQGGGRTAHDYGRMGRVSYDFRDTTDGEKRPSFAFILMSNKRAVAGLAVAWVLIITALLGFMAILP